MSWLAKSLANSFVADDSDEEEQRHSLTTDKHSDQELHHRQQPPQPSRQSISSDEESPVAEAAAAGVKEDLSQLTKTLTRQFWGVASFLAPPPPPPPPPQRAPSSVVRSTESDSIRPISHGSSDSQDSGYDSAEAPTISGIRSDFAEIGGKFRSGMSRISGNKAVTEISKIASSFLPFGSDGKDLVGGAIGVTDEVLAFARNIAMHPETWLDFPLFVDDDYSDDFDMSDAQQEHALAVERLAPRLAALRIELCPSHMSEGCFWKIYFVLLHSRLSKHDAELLLTPQIVEARAMWLQELQNRTKQESDRFRRSISYVKDPTTNSEDHLSTVSGASEMTTLTACGFEPRSSMPATDFETEKHPIVTSETQMIDKSVVEEGPRIQIKSDGILSSRSKPLSYDYEDDEDDWLAEEHDEIGAAAVIPLGNEEDVSFSDLEDDYDGSAPTSSKTLPDTSGVSVGGSRGWVQLDKNPGDAGKDGNAPGTLLNRAGQLNASRKTKESSDWLDVEEDIDMVRH